VRRSARLVSRFRPEGACLEGVVGVPAAGFRAPSPVGSVVASASSRAPQRAMPGRIRIGRDGALSQGRSLRTVRIVLEKCDRLIGLLGSVRTVSVAVGKCDNSNKATPRIGNASERKKRVRFADPIQTHLEVAINEQNRESEANSLDSLNINALDTNSRKRH